MTTEAQKRSRNKWDSANMTVVGCKVKKTDADRYRAAAAVMGTTVNAVCKEALEDLVMEAERRAERDGN
jgi:hypothetical protein